MQVTWLEIVLAVVAVFIIFGPKRLPRRGAGKRVVRAEKERLPVRDISHIQPVVQPYTDAAARAPSPLQERWVERSLPTANGPSRTGSAPAEPSPDGTTRFAGGQTEGSPLPHELPS